MNTNTVFYLKLIAKKNAYKMMIESCLKDAVAYPHKSEFFTEDAKRFEEKLKTTEEIINDYLIG
jgi:hypothetical protein